MANVLGKVIRKRRKELGWKVYELANKAKVKPEFITQIEKGHRLPSETVLKTIAKILGIDIKPYYYFDKHPDIGPYLNSESWEMIRAADTAKLKLVKIKKTDIIKSVFTRKTK